MLILLFVLTKYINLFYVFLLWGLAVIINNIFSFLFYRKHLIKFNFNQIKTKIINNGLKFSLPLIMFMIGSWIIVSVERYILNYFLGIEKVAIYSLTYSLLSAILTMGGLISGVFQPYIAEEWNKNKHNILINLSIKYTLLLIIPSIVGFYCMKESIIVLISGTRYLESATIVWGLILYPLLAALTVIIYQVLLLRERTKLVGYIHLIGAFLNIILNFLLIPIYGLIGAGIATTISYGSILFGGWIFIRKDFILKLKFIKPFKIIFASLIMGVFVSFRIILNEIIVIIMGIVIYLGLIYLFRVFDANEKSIMKKVIKL